MSNSISPLFKKGHPFFERPREEIERQRDEFQLQAAQYRVLLDEVQKLLRREPALSHSWDCVRKKVDEVLK